MDAESIVHLACIEQKLDKILQNYCPQCHSIGQRRKYTYAIDDKGDVYIQENLMLPVSITLVETGLSMHCAVCNAEIERIPHRVKP